MERTISHTIEIDRPPADVWKVLTATSSYPTWNPFITELSGELSPGSRLEVSIAPPGRRAMTFRPTVTEVRTQRALRWRGRVLLPGLLDGEHSFDLHELPSGRTRLVQSERFSGVLLPLLRSVIAPTRRGFEQMNHALKARAERP